MLLQKNFFAKFSGIFDDQWICQIAEKFRKIIKLVKNLAKIEEKS